MLKNTASQVISALLLDTAGAAVTTGTTTVYVTGDGGTQASGGTATHEGNGSWSFLPSQANTNYDHVTFTFVNVGAVSTDIQIYTTSDLATAINTIDTNVDAILVDTGTTLPATLAGTLDCDVLSISGSTTAADNLELSAETMVGGAVGTGTPSTTIFNTDLSAAYAVDDALNSRVLLFLSNTTTTALRGQGGVISSYDATGGEITISSPLTVAPANGDTFIIV